MEKHQSLKGITDNGPTADAAEWSVAYDFLSGMMAEALVVLDFDQKVFQYMPNYGLIACGYVQGTSMMLDSDFLKKVIHPKDISFMENTYTIISDSLNNGELPADRINYFSFLLRVKSSLLFTGKSDYFMIYVKLKPRWVDSRLRYGICMLSPSVIRKQENELRVHYTNMDDADYCFKTKKWEHHSYSPLSNRQKEMLIWAQQGFSLKETADKMNVTDKTIESIRYTLFEKFGVNTIEQAILYAFNRRLIFHAPSVQLKPATRAAKQSRKKE